MTGATAFLKPAHSGEFNLLAQERFLALYPNRHKSILKDASRKSDWVTLSRHAPLQDSQIVDAISLKENLFRGCRWGEQTKFAVLDIDKNSQLHNELGLARLRHSLASVGFDQPLIFQSSDSKGWHLYLSLASWTNCAEVQNTLRTWLLAEGYEIRLGQLEIFPSNNGLRLPLQKGFAWLNDRAELQTSRESLSVEQAITNFLKALEANAHDFQGVRSRIENRLEELAKTSTLKSKAHAIPQQEDFSDFFTRAGFIPEVFKQGQNYWADGLTNKNQRHHAILCLGHYLWYGDQGKGVRALPGVARAKERAAVIETWLRTNHNGHSEAVLRGDWDEINSDIHRACFWTASEGTEQSEKSYPLSEEVIDRLINLTKQTGRVWSTDDFKKGNIKREETAREKISAALAVLLDAGTRITIRAIERLSGCRRETIRRHADIWGALRLSNGLGDLSCPRSDVLSSSDSDLDLSTITELELEQEFESVSQTFKEVLRTNFSMVFDSLRLRFIEATANDSTATRFKSLSPLLNMSLTSGSNTGACSARKFKPKVVRSLNGFLPSFEEPALGPLHLPRTNISYIESSGHQSNGNRFQIIFHRQYNRSRAP